MKTLVTCPKFSHFWPALLPIRYVAVWLKRVMFLLLFNHRNSIVDLASKFDLVIEVLKVFLTATQLVQDVKTTLYGCYYDVKTVKQYCSNVALTSCASHLGNAEMSAQLSAPSPPRNFCFLIISTSASEATYQIRYFRHQLLFLFDLFVLM